MKCWTALLAFGLLLLVVGCKSRPAVSTSPGANGAAPSAAPLASAGGTGAAAGVGLAGSPSSPDASSPSASSSSASAALARSPTSLDASTTSARAGLAGGPAGPNATASSAAAAPVAPATVGTMRTELPCSGVAASTLSVVVTDARSEEPICDAEVSAQHESGYALELRQRRLANGRCPYVSFKGSEGKFTVSARKPGFAPANQTTTMVRRACTFHAPAVRLVLQPN